MASRNPVNQPKAITLGFIRGFLTPGRGKSELFVKRPQLGGDI
jgi:hypothetical protein